MTKDNLLRTTVFDLDLEVNIGNDTDVLECVWNSFNNKYPSRAKGIQSSLNVSLSHADVGDAPVSTATGSDFSVDGNNGSENEQEEKERRKREAEEADLRRKADQNRLETLKRQKLRQKADDFLS